MCQVGLSGGFARRRLATARFWTPSEWCSLLQNRMCGDEESKTGFAAVSPPTSLTPPTMQHRKDEAHLRSDSCYRPASTLLPAFAGERTSALVVWINSHHVVASPEPACVSVSSLCSVHRNPGCGAESYGWTGFVAGPVDLGGRTDMPRDRLHSALDLPEARPTRAKISLG